MKFIKHSGILIPSEYQHEEFYRRIRNDLTRTAKSYQTDASIIHRFYTESEKFLKIPRHFPLHKYVQCTIENQQCEGDIIDIEHNITPRSDTQQKAIDKMLSTDYFILQLSPGVGKTVISIYMVAERKLKTLILVHRDALADQWKERFLQFTNLTENDIARVKSSTVQEDLLKPIIIFTVQTFISLLKRSKEEFLIALNKANIGIFIGDEVHTTVGAPTFSECSVHIPSKYTYGLSATPYRYDGNGDIIEYHLGKVFADSDSENTLDARVTAVLLDYEIDTPYRTKYLYWGGDFQRARYLNLIKKSKPFLLAIKGILSRLKNERDMLIMVERIKLIDELYSWVNHKSKSKFCGTAKRDQLEYKITFTTPGKCRDGIDVPWKDCLIMTSPISNIEQVSGRITRPADNKKEPIVIDMVDYGCSRISNTFKTRYDYYQRKNWKVQFVLFKDKVLREIDSDQAFNIIRRV